MKNFSIEYAHIYTNNQIGNDQRLSLELLNSLRAEYEGKDISFVVMVDDYSFPDPSFDYGIFTQWLAGQGFPPDIVIRESQLIPSCDEVLKLVDDEKIQTQIMDYIKTKKYPCSLFVATWYLIRLGCIQSQIFDERNTSERLINILPLSFKPFEDKAFEIIKSTPFGDMVEQIENKYFEGRLVA